MKWLTSILAALTVVVGSSDARAFDHSTFDKVLAKYVKNGRVNYAGLKQDKDFPKYLTALAGADPKKLGSATDQLAFWINAYNASCLEGVVKRYPLSSVQKVKKFFDLREHKVAGTLRSLNDIEHGILRKQFKEPRIHFALNCASLSCPALSSSAYTGSKLSAQLEAAGRRFVNDSSRNKFTPSRKTAQLSSIFKWYGKDFGSQSQLLRTLAKYAPASVASLLRSGNAKVSYLAYNWSLNKA